MATEKRVTRRQLLGGAASVSLPYIIPSGVLAQSGRPGANDRIVFGHIGIGGMGQSHVVPDSCAALCDVDDNKIKTALDNVRKRNPSANPATYKDFRQVLDRKDIDAVTIGTPDHWHAVMTVMACQAGKDVYSEKPTMRTIEEGRAMVNAARKYKRVVQIGTQGRSNSEVHKAAEFVRNGGIGKVNKVVFWHPMNFQGGWAPEVPVPANLDWEMWLGPMRYRPYTPDYHPFNFRWYMDSGGGFIRDRGNHALSSMNLVLDNDDYRGLIHVEAVGTVQTDSQRDAPYILDAIWEFPKRGLTVTWSQPGVAKALKAGEKPGEWGATYRGDRDTLILFGGDGGATTEEKARSFVVPSGGEKLHLHPTTHNDATQRHRENWYHCIKTRERPAADIEIGRRSCNLCILALIAYRLNRKLTFDASKDQFVNDPEANRFLGEPMRSPWRI